MANIPGLTTANPGVYSDVITQSRGVSLPGGVRIAAIIGEGSTDEILIATAQGKGKDGLNSSYTSTTGSDGRHFKTQLFPLVSNRTSLFKNGVTLVGYEGTIDSNAFSTKYDYRLDPTTGKIELQRAYIVDQGGSTYKPLSTNVGQGSINSLTLLDVNAPNETWTIRCVSVQRNNTNSPIDQTAKFIAFGSVSGAKLDANGNPVIWTANNNVVNNGVLSFSIQETQVASVSISPFREGDGFTIKVNSGVLSVDDSLTINYIPESYINDPVTLQGLGPVVNRHGIPSLDNNLSLGCQLAFGAGAPAVVTVQAAPPIPRRTSYDLIDAINSLSTNDEEFIFPLPLGVTPNADSDIHFFVTNNTTQVEQQILPNKLTFYTIDGTGPTLTDFINDTVPAPGGYSYFYSVIQRIATVSTGDDGYLARDPSFTTKGIFSSSETFDSTFVGKTLRVIDATNVANNGEFTVTAVSDGALYVTASSFSAFTNESPVTFAVIDPSTDLPVSGGSDTDGVLVSIIATDTATFTSAAVDFSLISGLLNKRLRITGSSSNNGVYDIIAYDSGTDTLTIKKAFVSESGLRYEVLDSTDVSNYIVVNRSVVPNGYALRVTIVDEKDAPFYDAGWIAALESLETVECDILVPLPKQTISTIFQNALVHCKTMSNIRNKKERVLYIGAIRGLTPDNLTGAEDAAVEDIGILEGIQGDSVTEVLAGNIEDLANYSVSDAFGTTYRCVYFGPDEVVVSINGSNTFIDGFYIAAAAAGYTSADLNIQNPLTNKVIPGITILRNKTYNALTLEALSQAGVSMLQPVSGGGRVVWGRTTTQSGFPEEEEISIVFIRDRIAKTMRAAFQGFIGTPETPDTQTIMTTRAVQVLNAFASQGLITTYKDLVVARDSTEPRQWNVSVRVQPAYPINWVYIKINVGQV
ncbi:MAG: hypothetical protein LC122_13155 [Chitinophagales bacterium]|nr:hypothetical protein [Chitinophagales bacterium]